MATNEDRQENINRFHRCVDTFFNALKLARTLMDRSTFPKDDHDFYVRGLDDLFAICEPVASQGGLDSHCELRY